MKAMWPVRVENKVKEAFEKAAAAQAVDVSALRRDAYDEFIANHPDFFDQGAITQSQSAILSSREVA